MPQHYLELSLPNVELGNSDAEFIIYQDHEKLGKIRISKGGLDYLPFKKKKPIKIHWTQFDQMVRDWSEKG